MIQAITAILILITVSIMFAITKIPLPVTVLFGALIMAIVGIIEPGDVFGGFKSDVVMLVTGMMIVCYSLSNTGCLESVVRKYFEKNNDPDEKKIIIAILISAMLFSSVVSNTASVCIFMPLIESIAKKSKGKITKKNTYMALGFVAIAGGNLTLIGSTPQLVAQSIMVSSGIPGMHFFDLTKGAILIAFIIIMFYIVYGFNIQNKMFVTKENYSLENYSLKNNNDAYNKKNKYISIIVFVLCILGFLFDIINIGLVAILGAFILFVTGCVSIDEIKNKVDWSTVLLLVGMIAISKGIESSGAGVLIAKILLKALGGNASNITVFILFVTIAVILGHIISRTAVAAILIPICIPVSQTLSINTKTLIIGIVLGISIAFALPTSTPPLTMTYKAGEYKFKDYVIIGGMLTLICFVAIIVIIPLLYGL